MYIKYIQTLALIIFTTFNFSLVYAAEGTEFGQGGGIDNLIGGYGQNAKTILNKVPFDNSKTAQSGVAQSSQVDRTTANQAINDNTQGILMSIFKNSGTSDSVTKNILFSFKAYACGPAQPLQGTFGRAFSSQEDCQKQLTASSQPKEIYSNIDINSLIGPLVYDAKKPDQDKTAKNFINAATQMVNPFELFDVSGLSIDKLSGDKFLRQYLGILRVYTAAQAAAISNLQQLYNERKPIDKPEGNLKSAISALQDAKLLDKSETPSALQLEKIMATQRIIDPNWQKSLVNDSPAALQRQMVVLLAQNLAEAYQTRMTLERLNATLSMLLLQQNVMVRNQLELAKGELEKASQANSATSQ